MSDSGMGTEAVWVSSEMGRIRRIVDRIAPSTLPVLITGESGTGKEVIARALHRASTRSQHKMVIMDCAAITPTLMESELFGHQKGAFTGATTANHGLASQADGSSFFLDEIGELPTHVQAKLLRLLSDGSYRPVGGTETSQVDLRVIAATNRDLEAEVVAGTFRRDLFHRLNGVRIHIKPLRERPDDILPLMEHYLGHFCARASRPLLTCSPETIEILMTAHWPGNVRELVNCAHFIASLAVGSEVRPADLPQNLSQRTPQPSQVMSLPIEDHATPISAIRTDLPYKAAKRAWLDIFEAHYIQGILEREDGNISAAARAAGMDRRSIQRMVKRSEKGD